MRVVFLTQWFDPEPGAIRGLPLARELMARGIDVEVITGFPNYPTGRVYPGYSIRPWQREVMDGVPVLRVALWPSHDGNPIHRVANYASFALSAAALGTSLVKPGDVVYAYHPPPTLGIPAAALRIAHRTPVVYHIADMWPESAVESGMFGDGLVKEASTAILDRYCKWVYGQASVITVLSPGFKTLLTQRGVPEEKIEVVYNWADDTLFHPLPRNEALARELGFTDRFNIVYAGNFGAFQGLETVVRAAARLKDVPQIQVVFVGTGVEEDRLKSLAATLGATNVLFLGRREMKDMPAINALSDALLIHLKDLPFFAATIPSKTQVSLASGRPVVMAVRGDAADVIARANAGLVVPPENDAELAQAFLKLYEMPQAAREQLGRSGRDYYLEQMALPVGATHMANLFESVANKARAGVRVATRSGARS